MCGIAGILKTDRAKIPRVQEGALRTTMARLRLRGPDDAGFWISESAQLGFVHTRLSILDLSSSGHQPMCTAEGSALTYNGEIYNFQALREQLCAGAPLAGSGDSEVLLHALARHGISVLPELDGMFAFAFFDARAKKLHLAVDPAGEKPLYTYWDGRVFAFASEIKGLHTLLEHEGDFTLDPEAFGDSLIFGYVPCPNTIYRHIQKLPAGHHQVIDWGTGSQPPEPYWDIPLGQETTHLKFSCAQADLRSLLRAAVKKRLVSDVPLGSFLSGGLDSSAVSFEAARSLRPEALKTFAATYGSHSNLSLKDKATYDESAFARRVAERIGSEHREIEIPTSGFDAESIIRHFDEPFGDSSAIPTYLLCAQTRAHVKVALTGDGGDELFGGYLRFRAALLSETHNTLWKLILSPLKSFRAKPLSWLSRAQRFRAALDRPLMQRLAIWNAFFTEHDLELFLNQKFDRLAGQMDLWDEKTKGLPIGQKVLYYNFKTYLFDDLLPKVDRTSMALGLELRAPFLDRALIEFAFRLPTPFKFDAFQTKKVLKAAYDQDLGKDITRRRKHGFAFPIDSFLRPKLGANVSSLGRLFPQAKLSVDLLAPQNLASKRYMLWSLQHTLEGTPHGP